MQAAGRMLLGFGALPPPPPSLHLPPCPNHTVQMLAGLPHQERVWTALPSNHSHSLGQNLTHIYSGRNLTRAEVFALLSPPPRSLEQPVTLQSAEAAAGPPVWGSTHWWHRVLEVALRNLNSTVFFGITDYWDASICLFHKVVGW